MHVPTAQKVLQYAWERCDDLIVALPFMLKQGAIYGNPWELHIQDDLTPERVQERYPGLEILYDCGLWRYCYYHKGEKDEKGTEII